MPYAILNSIQNKHLNLKSAGTRRMDASEIEKYHSKYITRHTEERGNILDIDISSDLPCLFFPIKVIRELIENASGESNTSQYWLVFRFLARGKVFKNSFLDVTPCIMIEDTDDNSCDCDGSHVIHHSYHRGYSRRKFYNIKNYMKNMCNRLEILKKHPKYKFEVQGIAHKLDTILEIFPPEILSNDKYFLNLVFLLVPKSERTPNKMRTTVLFYIDEKAGFDNDYSRFEARQRKADGYDNGHECCPI